MKSFKDWKENYTVQQVQAAARSDRKDYGAAWNGLQQVKDALELLAQRDPQALMTIVNKVNRELNNLATQNGEMSGLDGLASNARRFASKASQVYKQQQNKEGDLT
jgi:hypothetical protein